jgi:hypothetical protein
MIDRFVIYKALKNCLVQNYHRGAHSSTDLEETGLISLLIHDIFGGEILKTCKKKGWHFYNRIEGTRFDFTTADIYKSSDIIKYEDIPSSPGETHYYFEDETYSTFLMRFIPAFEEAVGLDKYKPGLTA